MMFSGAYGAFEVAEREDGWHWRCLAGGIIPLAWNGPYGSIHAAADAARAALWEMPTGPTSDRRDEH